MDKSKSGLLITGIVALVLGGGLGYAVGMNNDDGVVSRTASSNQSEMASSASAIDLRVGMNNLLREHVSSSLDVTRAIADDAPQAELDGALSSQTANAVAIAGAVGSVYGDEAKAKITEMFVEHIEASNDYARAVAVGDEAAKAAALKELEEYLTEISGFFSGAINGLPQDAVYKLLNEHETLLNESVQAYQDGDFVRSYETERKALDQVSGIADALAGGIVKTKPEAFKQ